MKYKYKINNLDCANCANKIEKTLNEDKNIKSANVNFSNLTLTVVTDIDNAKKYIEKVIKKVEPDVEIYDIKENIKDNSFKYDLLRLIIGVIISIIGLITKDLVSTIFILLGYIILLYKTSKNAIKLLKNKTLDENLLVTISCVGAYFTNNIHEGLMVIILYEIGKILEKLAVNNSRKSISELMDIKPLYANIENKKVNPEDVKIGDIITIKKGEKIPLDGIVVKGKASLNTSILTGESKLRNVNVNDEVLSGMILTEGLLDVKVTKKYSDSTVSRILDLVENASDRKAKTETFVSKAARIYTPIVLILAIITILVLPLFNVSFEESLYRGLVFLVISCPCAIAISVPLSYFSGIGSASKNGILVKGSDYLDSLSKIDEIIFDKTGTLTTGKFTDYKLDIIDNNYTEKEIKEIYLSGEVLSNHPIAKSIVNLFKKEEIKEVSLFKEITGKGIEFKIKNKLVKIGSNSFCKLKDKEDRINLTIDNQLVARLEFVDEIKKDSKKTINELKKIGIKTKMFTGDNKEVAENIAKKINIDDYNYELLPQDKYLLLKEEIKDNKVVAFVGDGINDAPSIALSSVGISMGSLGSESAIEASDVVIMDDNLGRIIKGISISKKTNKIIKQNLLFAISVKIIVLILSFFGIASMWQAVFADTGVTLITILNTTRILK